MHHFTPENFQTCAIGMLLGRAPSPADPITDAAAHWCMRLHADDCTLVEREAFSRWLAADPRQPSLNCTVFIWLPASKCW